MVKIFIINIVLILNERKIQIIISNDNFNYLQTIVFVQIILKYTLSKLHLWK